MHSCFTSSIFAPRNLDFKVKFEFVFRSEAVVFRRYVLALLSVGLLRKFEGYLVYLSLIRSYFLRCFSFFQKFLYFTYMLLWFRLIIPSFPAQIDDMRSRFSALSQYCSFRNIHVLIRSAHTRGLVPETNRKDKPHLVNWPFLLQNFSRQGTNFGPWD